MKGGAAEYLARVIADRLDLKVRLDKPSYLQRSFMATVSTVDADEAYLVGQTAVTLATQGVSGVMVTLQRDPGDTYRCTTGTAPLDQVANAERFLPDEYISAQGNGVTEAFLEYARPLIGQHMRGLARLEHRPVPARAGVRTK
jgi:6-phosphofructokinase 1